MRRIMYNTGKEKKSNQLTNQKKKNKNQNKACILDLNGPSYVKV